MTGFEVDWEGSQPVHESGRLRRKKYCMIFGMLLGVGALAAGISMAILATKKDNGDDSNTISAPSPTVGIPSTPGPTPTNAPNIRQIIFDNARKGGSEFDDENSYQSRAMEWVLTQDIPLAEFPDMDQDEQTMQLYALACLYYATYATESEWTNHHYGDDVALPGWFDSKGWVKHGQDVCDWYGLTCNQKGAVVKIQLDTNGLTGAIPAEIAFLKDSLEYIDLFNNMVHNMGDEGNSFLGELTNLKYLYYGQTSFQYDGIPSEIGLLTNLVEYDFSYTLYFGKIDGAIFENLSNLNYLVMDGNSFNSTLPEQLVNLPELEYLYSAYSFVDGDLGFISKMPKIYELWIDDNPGITGTIPPSVADSTTLASLSTTGCGLTGQIPSEISKMTDLVQLWAYDNELTGTIPTELGDLKKLKILQLQKNKVGGKMPDELCTRRRPFGRLEVLEVDCDGEVECADTCCTCCGEQCIGVNRERGRD